MGDFVYLSGQLPIDPKTNELVSGGIQEQTYQVMKNIEAILLEMGLEMRHILKTTVFITDMKDFGQMNEIYATYLTQPYPARSTVQVSGLAKGAKIEIECIVIDTLLYEQQVLNQQEGGCACGEEGCGEGCGEEGCGEGSCGE